MSSSDDQWNSSGSQQGAPTTGFPQQGQYQYYGDHLQQGHPPQSISQQQQSQQMQQTRKEEFQQQHHHHQQHHYHAQPFQHLPAGATQQMQSQPNYYQVEPQLHFQQQQQGGPSMNITDVTQQHPFHDSEFRAGQARYDHQLMTQFGNIGQGFQHDTFHQFGPPSSSSFIGMDTNNPKQAAMQSQVAMAQSSSMPNVQTQHQQPFASMNSWSNAEASMPTAPFSASRENAFDLFNSQFPEQFAPPGINGFQSGHNAGHEGADVIHQQQQQEHHPFGEPSGSLQRERRPAALNFQNQHHSRHMSQPAYLSTGSKLPQYESQHDVQQDHSTFPSAAANWHTHSTQYPLGAELQQRSVSADLLSPMRSDQFQSGIHLQGPGPNSGHVGDPLAFQLHHQSSFDRLTPTSSQHSGQSSNRPDPFQYGMPLNGSDGHISQPAFQYIPPHKQLSLEDVNSQSWFESPATSDVFTFPTTKSYNSHSPRKISTPQKMQSGDPSMTMMLPTQVTGLPTTPIPVENDSTDYRLSTAMANNAHISSITTPTKAKPRPRQKSQPKQQAQQAQQQIVPSQSLQNEGSGSTLQMTEEQKQSGYGQQMLRMEPLDISSRFPQDKEGDEDDEHETGSGGNVQKSATIRRHRPKIRPNIFQQYSSSTSITNEPMSNLQDCTFFMGEVLSEYLASPSRLGMGERSVLIMTSKVAQKSYGNEKRFLCPPPMVLLVGSSWWSSCQDNGLDGDQNELKPTLLTPPRLNIAMSGEAGVQDSQLEWASHSGRLIDVENPSCEMAISGRSIGRQLFINDADEKRRHCEALASISMPGKTLSDRRHLGIFSSKPIKVISKPSKKRQSNRTSDFSVNHGSTISLFHRLRSQTVSTRYLCVSGAPTWFKGSDGISFLNSDANTHIPNQTEPASCFVAKMSSWDPFIIYLVDPHMEAPSTGANSGKIPPVLGYPPPPSNILSIPAGVQGKPICYNQAVVLQCLNTAVVSPVMIIRKVERNTIVVGGGQSFNSSGAVHMGGTRIDPTEEALGDPVSQLHKIAFETLEDANAPVPIAENRDVSTPGQSGPFLGCLNEEVGLNRPMGSRQWTIPGVSGPSTPTTPSTPSMMPMTSSSSSQPSSAKASSDPFDATTRMMMMGGDENVGMELGSMFTPGPSNLQRQHQLQQQQQQLQGDMAYDHSLGNSPGVSSDEGSGNKRARRLSSSITMSNKDRTGSASSLTSLTSAKNRRRGQSLSMLSMQKAASATPTQQHHQQSQPSYDEQWNAPPNSVQSSSFSFTGSMTPSDGNLALRRSSSFAHSISNLEASSSFGGIPAGAMWSVEVHDSDIWTIVGVDIARHTFYIPTKLVGGVRSPINAADQNIAHLINVPAPAMPITPIPVILQIHLPASSKSSSSSESKSSKGKSTTAKGGMPALTRPTEGFITLMGEHFSHDLFVYFGDWKSTRVTFESGSVMYCEPPPVLDEYGYPRGRVAIVLVRRDGVVFPSQHTYAC